MTLPAYDSAIVPVCGMLVTDLPAGLLMPRHYRVRKCAHCGAAFYLSKNAVKHARLHLQPGKALQLLCHPCAKPWIDKLAMKGGQMLTNLPPGTERLASDYLADHRRQIAEGN